jgi:hypothetical protein
MATYDPVVRELADRLRARNISRLVYFHCDHFEPWVNLGQPKAINELNAEHLHIFADDSSKFDYARRLTLFYCVRLNFVYDRTRDLIRAADDDFVGFVRRPPDEWETARKGMKYLTDTVRHEIQLHLHHEGFTSNTSHKHPALVEYYKSDRARALDGERIALALNLSKEAVRQETDIDLQNWYFVHGHWALNGSDDDTCQIADELQVLMGLGCRGDFTFPAGRDHVNPRLEVPYFCKPFEALRGYDQQGAEPEFAYGNAGAAAGKFFIWASKIKHNRSSIDYYAPWVRQNLEKPDEWARDIVDRSFAVDGTMFFKTHSHSMFPYYREFKRRPIYPHAHPGVQTLFSIVFDAASTAGAEVEFLTVSEVYDRFVSAQYRPEDGFSLTVPHAAGGNGQQRPVATAWLVDIDRFVDKRDNDEQRQALLTRLQAAGFTKLTKALDLGDSGQYYINVK